MTAALPGSPFRKHHLYDLNVPTTRNRCSRRLGKFRWSSQLPIATAIKQDQRCSSGSRHSVDCLTPNIHQREMLDDTPKQRCPFRRVGLSSQTEDDGTPSSKVDRGERVSPDFLPSLITSKDLSHTISTTPCISLTLISQLTQTVRRAIPAVRKVSLASSSGMDRPARQARKASSK